MSARLELIVGPMFSGKTERLLVKLARAQYAKKRILVIKPAIDTRTDTFIASRGIMEDGTTATTGSFEAILIYDHEQLRSTLHTNEFDVLAVDEAQFFPNDGDSKDGLGWFGSEIRNLLQERKNDSLHIYVAGLDRDFAEDPFGSISGLLALADSVEKLSAVCMQCGADDARLSQRIFQSDTLKDTQQISIGDIREYQARCRACYSSE
jgi:thymidine kinase